jgi:peptidoglycan/xylan/chitin deacetylase (PgdA/CDA1 family)
MKFRHHLPRFLSLIFFSSAMADEAREKPLAWPEGKRMALSLSFDDSRLSNLEHGIPLLNELGVHATFFVLPSVVEKDLERWKAAVAKGHEIGNHSLTHPCSGNIVSSPEKATLEGFTLEMMRAELIEANSRIENLLGVKPVVYAYPCGQTFVGRGKDTVSFIPLVAELFLAGRGWLDERPNHVRRGDMAQLTGVKMDGETMETLKPMFDIAQKEGRWLILAGHDTGKDGSSLNTTADFLRSVAAYAKDPANGVWIAPIGTIAEYVEKETNDR